ncbi:MAG: transposase [Solobacterium sp.]|nr:transposase [Solobacterium sp.]
MYLGFSVKIPEDEKGISKKKIKGTTYVYYEHGRKYYADKKYTVPQCTTIGKECEDDPEMMIPNVNFLKFFPDAELPETLPASTRSGCLKIGTWLVIQKVIRHYKLDERIMKTIGKDSGLFLDLAAYTIVTENNAAQYYPDYAYNHPLFTDDMKVYSDSKISRFLRDISRDDSIEFQNDWNAGRDHREKIYISYDSTNKHCQAGDIELAEFGHEKEKEKKPIFNFSIAYDKKNRLPLFYETYPGSIVDISQLQFMLEKAKAYGYKNAGFILDRGYFSEPNIRFMDKIGYEFVIMVKGCKDLVNELILKNKGSFEDEWENTIPYYDENGITVKDFLFKTDEKERYFHIYYDDFKKAKERARLQKKIREQKETLEKLKGTEEKLFKGQRLAYFDLIYHKDTDGINRLQLVRERKDVISRDIKLCGYFCIITSAEMTAEQALELYKSRDDSEKLFRGDKSYLGEKSIRVYQDEPTHSKIFIEFVALILRNKIYTCLKDRMKEIHKKKNYMTVPAALKELDKIELIRQADGVYRLDHAVTATQKDILQAFNLTAANVDKEAKELGKRLRTVTN